MGKLQQRIVIARKEAGLSEAELARRIGVSQSALHEFLKSKTDGHKKILEIARATGFRPEWLQWGELPRKPGEAQQPAPEPDHPPLYTGNLSARMVEIEG